MVKIRLLIALLLATPFLSGMAEAEEFTSIPAPAIDLASTSATETVVVAGGCFWGVQGVFQRVKGVTSAVSGYAGGMASTAEYERVNMGNTGHAESVKITYDPKQVSLGKLLQIYFSVAHDPTQVNRQGPDVGSQYRSAVFPANEDQAKVVKAYIEQLNDTRVYKAAIATKIEMKRAFYAAERYHQDYMTVHPRDQYIVYNDLPKVEALAMMYPELYRADPVLVYEKNKKK